MGGRCGNAPQQFILEEQEDGSFVIKTASSSGTCAVDGQYDPSKEIKNGSPVLQMTYNATDPHQKWYFIPVDTVTTDEEYLKASASYTSYGSLKTGETSVDGITTSYSYNDNWQLISSSTGSQTTNYSYITNTNQLSSVTSNGMTVGYTYSNDRLSKITTPTTDYNFTYDSFGRNTRIKSGDYTLSETTINSNGLVTAQKLLGATHTRSYEYDSLDRLKKEIKNNNRKLYSKSGHKEELMIK